MIRVVIVDDDVFKREGMANRLRSADDIDVAATVDQDVAAAWKPHEWRGVDVVLVDVCDDVALGQVGTDVYSGIKVVERVSMFEHLRCIAVTPVCAHPYVRLRLQHARPGYTYHRFQLNDEEELLRAVRLPDQRHLLQLLSEAEITELGGLGFRPNELVDAFVASPLHGHLRADSTHKQLKALGIPRSAIDAYCLRVIGAGFEYGKTLPRNRGEGSQAVEPRWNAIRLLTMKLLGRKDAPPTEHDQPWW